MSYKIRIRRWSYTILVCLALPVAARAQQASIVDGNLPTIPPEVARQNLITSVQPIYPPLAKAAHVVGIVRAEITIDEKGNVSVLRLVSGHPMLATAALEAIRKWKYKPFQVAGQATRVRTDVQVSIPENINQGDIDQERKFQDNYWPNERAGREALGKHDLVTAESRLQVARASADELGDQKWLELADVVTLLGTVKMEQEDFESAERFYKESLAIHEKHQRPDEAEVAAAQQTLGLLYFRKNELDKAEPLFADSVKSYEARMKDVSMPEPLAGYGRSLALGYFALAQIADAKGRAQESEEHCNRAASYAEKWSNASDKDVILSRCKNSSRGK